MSWFRKLSVVALLATLALATSGAKKADKTDAADSQPKKGDKKSANADDAKATPEPKGPKTPAKLSVPVPPGHDAKGLVIPYRDQKGNLQMRFTMEFGNRTDEDHMAMRTLLIETFDEEGKGEMTIDLPQSVLDLNTRVISTESGVVIKRADFELKGQTMEFNTETRAGHLGGKVHMLIYNLENETNTADEAPPSEK